MVSRRVRWLRQGATVRGTDTAVGGALRHQPTPVRRPLTARVRCWYATHPRWGRPALPFAVLQGLSIVAVGVAPRATASTNAAMLNFTGLSDSYGVPIGDYYLAVASVTDQITQAGPSVTANPG